MSHASRCDAPMTNAVVVAEEDVEGRRTEGDTALEKVVFGVEEGSRVLEQRVTRYAHGRSLPRGHDDRDELLFVASGRGTLELEDERHELEPDTAEYVRAGERYVIENEGDDELLVVSTSVP